MTYRWIVVADQSLARIFSMESRLSPLEERKSLVHPEGRQHPGELVSDRPGREAVPGGVGHHSVEPDVARKEGEAQKFAAVIAAELDRAHRDGAFDQLIVAAPPHMLGLLRKALSPAVADRIEHEVHKELSRMAPGEIREHLAALF